MPTPDLLRQFAEYLLLCSTTLGDSRFTELHAQVGEMKAGLSGANANSDLKTLLEEQVAAEDMVLLRLSRSANWC